MDPFERAKQVSCQADVHVRCKVALGKVCSIRRSLSTLKPIYSQFALATPNPMQWGCYVSHMIVIGMLFLEWLKNPKSLTNYQKTNHFPVRVNIFMLSSTSPAFSLPGSLFAGRPPTLVVCTRGQPLLFSTSSAMAPNCPKAMLPVCRVLASPKDESMNMITTPLRLANMSSIIILARLLLRSRVIPSPYNSTHPQY